MHDKQKLGRREKNNDTIVSLDLTAVTEMYRWLLVYFLQNLIDFKKRCHSALSLISEVNTSSSVATASPGGADTLLREFKSQQLCSG